MIDKSMINWSSLACDIEASLMVFSLLNYWEKKSFIENRFQGILDVIRSFESSSDFYDRKTSSNLQEILFHIGWTEAHALPQ